MKSAAAIKVACIAGARAAEVGLPEVPPANLENYELSPKRKAARARYDASPKGKARHARYRASPKGKATRAAVDARYRASPRGEARCYAKHERFRLKERLFPWAIGRNIPLDCLLQSTMALFSSEARDDLQSQLQRMVRAA